MSCIGVAVNGTPSDSYGVSLAIGYALRDHSVTCQAATRHTQVNIFRLNRLVLDLSTLEGWKAELT